MKSLSGRDFARIIERRGWTLLRIAGSHHIYVKPGFPVVSDGNSTLGTGLQRKLMKQTGLTDDDL